uniref:Cytochrome c biogenesis protein CcsA n=1 Tax=Dichotomaria marginata TaxID=268567 RepID=A0A1G4NS66_9FLOR|nr:Cytochrome c biogenesis protein ccs1 [Dichotomaria marginata]SCW21510.1 Cytochrome c biogenesis protein ccs1 [Dichotomaria marginata]
MNWHILQNTLVNISFAISLTSLFTCCISLTFPNIKNLNKINYIQILLINFSLSIMLGSRWIIEKYFPLSNLYESLLFLAWCITTVQIILEKQIQNQMISSVSAPIQMLIIAFASFALPQEMQKATPLVPALHSNWLMMHVTVMMLSYAFLIVGSLLSVLFLVIIQTKNFQNYQQNNEYYMQTNKVLSINKYSLANYSNTKQNNTGIYSLKRGNLLTNLDNLSYRVIGLGFPLLTLGIISGAVWANEAWGSYWSWDPKETWALITWLIFASYLHSRLIKSWQGKKPAILASVGFLIIWICYLGVNFLGQGLHSYGWLS